MSKEQALFDLGYEWWMYRKMHRLSAVLPKDEDPVRNAITESLLLHVRNLIETFWGPTGESARKAIGIKHEKMPAEIGRVYGLLSKCIVHLPDDRPAAKKDWDFTVVGPALEAKIDELREAKVIAKPWEGDRDPSTKLIVGGDKTSPDNGGALTAPISPTGVAMPPAIRATAGPTGVKGS